MKKILIPIFWDCLDPKEPENTKQCVKQSLLEPFVVTKRTYTIGVNIKFLAGRNVMVPFAFLL